MKQYLNIPIFEQDFFLRLLPKNYDLWGYQLANYGYITVDLGLTETQLQNLREEVDRLNNLNIKKQEQGYHYSKGNRLFETWKYSEALRSISLHPTVINILRRSYLREPIPFQTITFDHGSNQPLHSDVIHFSSKPERWLAACWVALEDMTENNGPLVYVPRSHKFPIYNFTDIGMDIPKYGEQFEAYAEYEKFIADLVLVNGLSSRKFICKAGQALIWAANLLHGGAKVLDENSTRYSHVTHYYFEGCRKYYSPMFSDEENGHYAEKDLTEKDFYL